MQAPTVDELDKHSHTMSENFWLKQIAIQLAAINDALAAIVFSTMPYIDEPTEEYADEIADETETAEDDHVSVS